MIDAQLDGTSGCLAQRLTNKAEALARAYAENAQRKARRDGWQWRQARLLWPLFTPPFTRR